MSPRLMAGNLVVRALRAAAKALFTAEGLARELGTSLGEAEALIGALIAHGYLREVEIQCCTSCPLSAACPAARAWQARVYVVTEKGLKLLSGGRSES